MESQTTNRPCFVCHDKNCKYRGMSPYVCMRDMKNKLEQTEPTLKERLTEFAKKAAKEAHDNEDIQKLAEGCIWIGAVWLARACNINIGVKIVTIDEILELPEVKALIDKCNVLGEEIKELKEKCKQLEKD